MNFSKLAGFLFVALSLVACSDEDCVDSGTELDTAVSDTDETTDTDTDTDTGAGVTDPVDTGDTGSTDTGSESNTTEE